MNFLHEVTYYIGSLVGIKFAIVVVDIANICPITRDKQCFSIKCILIYLVAFSSASEKWILSILNHRISI